MIHFGRRAIVDLLGNVEQMLGGRSLHKVLLNALDSLKVHGLDGHGKEREQKGGENVACEVNWHRVVETKRARFQGTGLHTQAARRTIVIQTLYLSSLCCVCTHCLSRYS